MGEFLLDVNRSLVPKMPELLLLVMFCLKRKELNAGTNNLMYLL
jgi:hypothetical protein